MQGDLGGDAVGLALVRLFAGDEATDRGAMAHFVRGLGLDWFAGVVEFDPAAGLEGGGEAGMAIGLDPRIDDRDVDAIAPGVVGVPKRGDVQLIESGCDLAGLGGCRATWCLRWLGDGRPVGVVRPQGRYRVVISDRIEQRWVIWKLDEGRCTPLEGADRRDRLATLDGRSYGLEALGDARSVSAGICGNSHHIPFARSLATRCSAR